MSIIHTRNEQLSQMTELLSEMRKMKAEGRDGGANAVQSDAQLTLNNDSQTDMIRLRQAAEKFLRLYGSQHPQGEGQGGDRETGGRSEGASEDAPGEARLDDISSIYSGLLKGGDGGTAMPVMAGGPTDAAGNMDDMVSGLVDRILASPVGEGGVQEVRLTVSADILPDTEIRLSRGLDGLLCVTLSTGREQSFQTLVAAQDSLRAALAALENKAVRLTVSNSGAKNASAGRRLRGYGPFGTDDE